MNTRLTTLFVMWAKVKICNMLWDGSAIQHLMTPTNQVSTYHHILSRAIGEISGRGRRTVTIMTLMPTRAKGYMTLATKNHEEVRFSMVCQTPPMNTYCSEAKKQPNRQTQNFPTLFYNTVKKLWPCPAPPTLPTIWAPHTDFDSFDWNGSPSLSRYLQGAPISCNTSFLMTKLMVSYTKWRLITRTN